METPHIRIESTGAIIRLRPDVTTIGRGQSVDVQLDHPSVSKLHAEIVRRGPYAYVSDLGLSRHGTRVNGKVVAQRLLENGDVLSFGSQRCRVGGLPSEDVLPETDPRRSAVPELTRREVDVVAALCKPALCDDAFVAPATARDIAADLVVTEAAVKQHLLRLYQKLKIAEGPNRRVGWPTRSWRAGWSGRCRSQPPGEPAPGAGADPLRGARRTPRSCRRRSPADRAVGRPAAQIDGRARDRASVSEPPAHAGHVPGQVAEARMARASRSAAGCPRCTSGQKPGASVAAAAITASGHGGDPERAEDGRRHRAGDRGRRTCSAAAGRLASRARGSSRRRARRPRSRLLCGSWAGPVTSTARTAAATRRTAAPAERAAAKLSTERQTAQRVEQRSPRPDRCGRGPCLDRRRPSQRVVTSVARSRTSTASATAAPGDRQQHAHGDQRRHRGQHQQPPGGSGCACRRCTGLRRWRMAGSAGAEPG